MKDHLGKLMSPQLWESLRGQIYRLDFRLLAVAALIAGGCWVFVEVADEVNEGETRSIDTWLLHQLRNPDDLSDPIGPEWLAEAMRDITALGSTTVLTLIVVAAAVYLLLMRKKNIFFLLVVAAAGAGIVTSLLKSLFNRPRPSLVDHLTVVSSASFPSGHSLASAAIYLTIGVLLAQVSSHWRARVYFILVALMLSFIIGFSRMYLGVHYPSDVLAGLALGYSWGLFSWWLADVLKKWRGA